MKTFTALPIQFQAMTENFKMMIFGNLLLQLFDARIFEFDNRAAPNADQMIVVRFAVCGFVTGLAITEMPRLGNTGVGEKAEGSINSGITDGGVLFPKPQIKLLGGQVGGAAQKLIQNDLPLSGRFQPLLGQIFPESPFYLRHRPTTLKMIFKLTGEFVSVKAKIEK